MAGILADRCGGTAEAWRSRMTAETTFTAAEAVAAGLCHEIQAATEPEPEPSTVDGHRRLVFARDVNRPAPRLSVLDLRWRAPRGADPVASVDFGRRPVQPLAADERAAVEVGIRAGLADALLNT